MIRAFVALALPEPVRFDLMLLQSGLPLPRPVPAENLHLTLVFLGELPEPVVADVDLALGRLRAPGFEVALAGLDAFGGPKPRAVYVGVAGNPALAHLQSKVAAAARAAGVEIESRRFVPHVTLARLKPGEVDPSASAMPSRCVAATPRRGSRPRTSASTAPGWGRGARPTRSSRATPWTDREQLDSRVRESSYHVDYKT